ncbi:ABC transporter ATP-binding protein [Compostibacter hankyongensis]|uniref:ABC transporter ATP-binding protein n=1 Tax=Compostibacter hankyongensis TaxID=1007089 RepID=A0ABP8FG99_9BACT
MTISLENIGKRFNYEWVFRHLSTGFHAGNSYAILGPNGSGKSTLLQLLAGSLQHSEGSIRYSLGNRPLPQEQVFRHLALATPYLELIEELTLMELLRFHARFKPFLPGVSLPQIMKAVQLEKAADKQIRYFSSGMKQRARLAQAVFSDVPVLFLDEPCSNLDAEGIGLYGQLIREYQRERLVVISSNDEQEYSLCTHRLSISDYK